MIRIAWYTFVILATLMVLVLLWQFRTAIILFMLSLATASAIRPTIDRLTESKLPRGLALILAYAIVILAIAGLGVLMSGPLGKELQHATDRFADGYESIKTNWPIEGSEFQKALANQLPLAQDLFGSLTGERGNTILRGILGIASNFFGAIGNLAIILILSLYWNGDNVHFERLWLSIIPVNQRIWARDIWRSIEKGVGAYISIKFIQSILAGVLLWIGYTLLGMNYPILFSLIGAFASLIPWLGVILAILPTIVVALVSNMAMGLVAGAFTLVVFLLLYFLVDPRLSKPQNYSSILLVLIAIALTDAFGIAGLILAPPLAVAIQIFSSAILQRPVQAPIKTIASKLSINERAEALRSQLLQAQELFASQENGDSSPSPEMISLMDRLDRLVHKTSHYLESEVSEES